MSAIGTSWDGPGPPSVVVVRAHLAELRRREANRPVPELVAVPVEELRAVEEALEGTYEGAVALADEGRLDFSGFGGEVKAALALVRRWLAERAP